MANAPPAGIDAAVAAPPLRVAYVFMQFPVPSQTFATVDVRQLLKAGVALRCDCLRGAHPAADRLLQERGIEQVPLTTATWKDLVAASWFLLRHPLLTMGLVSRACSWGLPSLRHLLAGLSLVPRILALTSALESWRPQVVHLFWGHYPSLLGWLIRRRLPTCVLSHFLGTYDMTHAYRGSHLLAAEADVLLTHAQANLTDLAALGIDTARMVVIHRGIDPETITRAPREKIRGRIVLASRLTHEKGVDVALRAVALARKINPDVHLHVLGDGPERARLTALTMELGITQAVTFQGHVPHATVFEEMDRAEIALLLSWGRDERVPNAVKEAMACRCAVIASRTAGIEELISDGISGVLVDTSDHVAAGTWIGRLLNEPATRTRLVDAARATIETRFNAANAMARYVQCWRTVLAQRESPERTP